LTSVLVLALSALLLGPANYSSGNPALDFFYAIFNGIAEIPLLSSPITGILILAGVFLASRKAGIMMVLSSGIGAGMGVLLGAPYGLVTFGLFGYNSILSGMAFWSGPFTKTNRVTFVISVFNAAATAVVWMAFSHLFGDLFVQGGQGWAIPGFTSSFGFASWAIMLATKRFGYDIWPSAAPSAKEELLKDSSNPSQTDNFKWTAKEFIIVTFRGVAQVTFVDNWKTGVFWVVGLTLAFELAPLIAGQDRPFWTNAYTAQWDPFSPLYLGGLMAFLGSAIGAAMAILTKLPTAEIRLGLHGFNQVLVMIALTSFLPLTPQSFLIAVFATVSASFVMPALQRFFGLWGLPAFTAPFNFTTWVFLMGISGFHNIPAGIGWSRPPGS
jgi:urea transporter